MEKRSNLSDKVLRDWGIERDLVRRIFKSHPTSIRDLEVHDSNRLHFVTRYWGDAHVSIPEIASEINADPLNVRQELVRLRSWMGIGNDSELKQVIAHGPPPIHLNINSSGAYFALKKLLSKNPKGLDHIDEPTRTDIREHFGLDGISKTSKMLGGPRINRLKEALTEMGINAKQKGKPKRPNK